MKPVIALALLVIVISVYSVLSLADAASTDTSATSDDAEAEEEYKKFKITHKRNHTDPAEDEKRKKHFKKTHAFIKKHNKEHAEGKHNYTLGHNHLSDLSEEELKNMQGYIPNVKDNPASSREASNDYIEDRTDLPKSVDWRKQGAITSVNCNVCWIFAAVGALEAHYFISSGKLVDLSEQQLLDCINGNCWGGAAQTAFSYIRDNGIELLTSYSNPSYTASFGGCRYNKSKVETYIVGSAYVPDSGNALKAVLAKIGPVTVGIHGNSPNVYYLKDGIYTPNCSDVLDHEVLLVGYDTTASGQDYWIVKNSWGPTWGNAGFFNIASNGDTLCGISGGYYPVIAKSASGCYVDSATFPNTNCIFPFIYYNHTYNGCITPKGAGKPWCPTKLDANGAFVDGSKDFAYCSAGCPTVKQVCTTATAAYDACIFPFTYQGATYNSCTTAGGTAASWCATKVDATGVATWGYCDAACPV